MAGGSIGLHDGCDRSLGDWRCVLQVFQQVCPGCSTLSLAHWVHVTGLRGVLLSLLWGLCRYSDDTWTLGVAVLAPPMSQHDVTSIRCLTQREVQGSIHSLLEDSGCKKYPLGFWTVRVLKQKYMDPNYSCGVVDLRSS